MKWSLKNWRIDKNETKIVAMTQYALFQIEGQDPIVLWKGQKRQCKNMANVASILSVRKWTFVRSHLSHRVRTTFIEGKLSPSLPSLDSWFFVKVSLSLGFFLSRLDLRFLVIFADAISLVYWQTEPMRAINWLLSSTSSTHILSQFEL